MPKSKRTWSLLCASMVGVVACSLPQTWTDEDGPQVVLTQSEPVAEFDIKLCITGSKIDSVDGYAELEVVREASNPDATGIVRAELGDGSDEDQEDLTADEDPPLTLTLDGEGPWENRKGRRCSDPQRVRFIYEGDDEMAMHELSWNVEFSVSYSDGLVFADSIDESDMSIEIEPVL